MGIAARRAPFTVIPFCAAFGFLALGFGGDDGDPDAGTDDPAYDFAAPLGELMAFLDDVFYDMPDKVDARKYRRLKREAYYLAEMANLFTHVKEHRDNKEWLDLSESMKSDALKLAKAAKNKDAKEMKSLHAKLDRTCESCHDKFRDN